VQPRRVDLRLRDILTAAKKIEAHTSAMSLDSFRRDEWAVDAVLRNLTVMGEAAGRLPVAFIAQHPEVPWNDVRDMRNLIVHEYFGVDVAIVWETIRKDIPTLIAALEEVLRSSE
jgi:uncharacterized protein with HEPN domain